MKSFDEIWAFTDKIPGSFTRLNGERLYEYAMQVPKHGIVVEVGVDQGRSASLLLESSRTTEAVNIFVDSWESVLIDNMGKVEMLVDGFADAVSIVDIWNMKSVDAARQFNGAIDLIHIDANHYDDNPAWDCVAWLPKLRSGGVACFHDYMATFPAVTEAVDKYTAGWGDLGVWDSLAIRRKP